MSVLPTIHHVLLHSCVLLLLVRREHRVDLRIGALLDRAYLGAAVLLRKRRIAARGSQLLLTILQNRRDLGGLSIAQAQLLAQSFGLLLRIGRGVLRC